MGQRLNIEIIETQKVQANAYYHWSGYTSSTIRLTKIILAQVKKEQEQEQEQHAAIRAIRLLETTGALLLEEDIEAVKKIAPNEVFEEAVSRNNGMIAMTEKNIEITRKSEESRMTIDLDKQILYSKGVINDITKEECLEYFFTEEYEALPLCDFALGDIPFEAFETWSETVLQHISNKCYYLRLEDGKVVTFIE